MNAQATKKRYRRKDSAPDRTSEVSCLRQTWRSFWYGSGICGMRRSTVLLVVGLFVLVVFLSSGRRGGLLSLFSISKWTSVPSVTYKEQRFLLDSRPVQFLSGAMHYFRVPPEYWRDRLRKLRACGLNTVETYVPWNLHEETPGKYNFTGQLDLARFLEIAQEEGLYVIFRPGPYICAEWDLGGLPAWLLRDEKMKLRTRYKGYLEAVERYFKVLIPKILPYQHREGGPVVLVQVENEYGSYRQDRPYLVWLKDVLVELGVKETLFTSDGFQDGKHEAGSIPGVLTVINDRDHVNQALDALQRFQPDKPLMVGEFWSGWFDHWQEQHHTFSEAKYVAALESILQRDASVNLYMFHGGTNFGFLNGANSWINYADKSAPARYNPTITSYDYDSPVSESGELTQKYYATCRLMEKYSMTGYKFVPEVFAALKEASPKAFKYGKVPIKDFLTLTDALKFVEPWTVTKLVPMEQMCDALTHQPATPCVAQNFGFVVYRTQAPASALNLFLKMKVADRALIMVDRQTVATVDGETDNHTVELQFRLPQTQKAKDVLVLVENQGRINYENFPRTLDNQRKGLLTGSSVRFDDTEVPQWQIYPLEMKPEFVDRILEDGKWTNIDAELAVVQEPAFYRTSIDKQHVDAATGKDEQYPPDTFWNYNVSAQFYCLRTVPLP